MYLYESRSNDQNSVENTYNHYGPWSQLATVAYTVGSAHESKKHFEHGSLVLRKNKWFSPWAKPIKDQICFSITSWSHYFETLVVPIWLIFYISVNLAADPAGVLDPPCVRGKYYGKGTRM